MACTQIPVLIEERDGKVFISGHIVRKSDHEKAFAENPQALMVFTSPHSYVSGTWYTGKPGTASTWDYISVHARGELKWMDDQGLIAFMRKFTLHFENGNDKSTTIYDNLTDEYLGPLMKAIIGFEMEVIELENVHKVSQNRDEKSYMNIIEKLEQKGDAGKFLAGKMKENASRLFNGSK